jgi:pSer/pThr/pTyr-binding forkhead associated (FHA) protein
MVYWRGSGPRCWLGWCRCDAEGGCRGKAGCLVAYLRVETDEGARQVALDRDCFTVGRLPANDIMIRHQQVSRYHAELRASPEGWWIADLESTNGIQVDGRRVQRHLLRSGEPVQLAPGVVVALVSSDNDDDVAVQPTAYVPALSTEREVPVASSAYGRNAAVMGSWLPTSGATAWRASNGRASAPRAPSEESGPVEGDLFRRKRSRLSGAPAAETTPGAIIPNYGAHAAHLHLCQTCGQQTAPDSVHCQTCGTSIARECRACRLSLLPIQDLCPRCQTPNPNSVLRARRAPTSA